MMPSCDQTGVPIHLHSSTTSGSASLMSLRILPRVSPRQSPSSAILFEMSFDADQPWLAPDFCMFSSLVVLVVAGARFPCAGRVALLSARHKPHLLNTGGQPIEALCRLRRVHCLHVDNKSPPGAEPGGLTGCD